MPESGAGGGGVSGWFGSLSRGKQALVIVVAFLFVGAVFNSFGDTQEATEPGSDSTGEATEEQPVQEAAEEEEPAIEQTPEEHLQALIEEELGDRLRDVSILTGPQGGYALVVEFNASDAFTSGMIRRAIERDMQETYQALYTSGESMDNVGLAAYFPMSDQFGNESMEPVYRTNLDAATADSVNWDNGARIQWNAVWDENFLHPELR